MKLKTILITLFIVMLISILFPEVKETKQNKTYTIVDTGQKRCFDNRKEINYPKQGEPFYGQDAHYTGHTPSYINNGDGTITDLNTGLIWQKTPDFIKRTLSESKKYADSLRLAGYNDWRLPTIKELFSIADFNGNMHTKTPYINTEYFDFKYPDTSQGGRIIDAQFRSSTEYVGLTMRGEQSVFGFNFADGRIKSYPNGTRRAGKQYVRCVRGNIYGCNDFIDMGDGTVKDKATGLIWMKVDSGKTMTWQDALKYAEELNYAGYNDWRLPNIKELQSIVDYSKAPDARKKNSQSAAIDPIFNLTKQESWFWSSTTHIENRGGYYVCFGQGFSAWLYQGEKMNAHGAGAVRSDPKNGNPKNYSQGKGPQGDEIRIYNYVRCVRGGNVKKNKIGPNLDPNLKTIPNNRPQKNTQNRSMFRSKRNLTSRNQTAHNKRFIQHQDTNGDGKVSKIEFKGPKHHFNMFDKNGDGFIDISEAPQKPPQKRFRR